MDETQTADSESDDQQDFIITDENGQVWAVRAGTAAEAQSEVEHEYGGTAEAPHLWVEGTLDEVRNAIERKGRAVVKQ